MEAHHTLTCVPLHGILVQTSLVIDSPSVSSRRGYSSYGIVDTKTIWFLFLSILPCWRVFFLGSPALHNAGTDRLQMVGVRSLHVDGSWLLVSSSTRRGQHCSTSNGSEVRHIWDQILCSTFSQKHISESCNKMMEMWIKRILSYCFILYCGSSATSREEAGEERRTKNFQNLRKIVQ